MPSGNIGNYKYYTQEDIINMINKTKSCDFEHEQWLNIQDYLFDMADLIKKYAKKLYDYEYYYIDDRR